MRSTRFLSRLFESMRDLYRSVSEASPSFSASLSIIAILLSVTATTFAYISIDPLDLSDTFYVVFAAIAASLVGAGLSVSLRRSLARKPAIFVSYSRDQYDIASYLVRELMRGDYRVFDPNAMIPAGADMVEATERAIDEADFIVLVLPPSGEPSPTVMYELNLAMSIGRRVIPVGGDDPSELPLHLQRLKRVSLAFGLDSAWIQLQQALEHYRRGGST